MTRMTQSWPACLSRIQIALALLLVATGTGVGRAQLPNLGDAKLGVDAIRLTDGTRLYGFILEAPDGVDPGNKPWRLALERKWLEATHPEYYEAQVTIEKLARTRAIEKLAQRTEQWITETDPDSVLFRYLKNELLKITPDGDAGERSPFMVLVLAGNEVRGAKFASPRNRQIAGLAYQAGLSDVVTTSAASLLNELKKRNIDVEKEVVDLQDQLPSIDSQSERQWAARKALFEFHMLAALEFQGTGDTFIQKGKDSPEIGELVGQFLGGGAALGSSLDAVTELGIELGLPEFKNLKSKSTSRNGSPWWKKITAKAEASGARGVLLTKLNQSLLSPTVSVEVHFAAMLSPGEWIGVFSYTAQSSTNDVSQDQIERLKNDPQIEKVLSIVASLGLDGRLEEALRHGAATENAMLKARGEFDAFLGKHIQSLAGRTVEFSSTLPQPGL